MTVRECIPPWQQQRGESTEIPECASNLLEAFSAIDQSKNQIVRNRFLPWVGVRLIWNRFPMLRRFCELRLNKKLSQDFPDQTDSERGNQLD